MEHVDHGAALAQRLGKHVAGVAGAGDEDAGAGDGRGLLLEGVQQALGDVLVGDEMTGEAVRLERGGRRRADGGHDGPGGHAAVLRAARQVAGEDAHGVGAREHDQLVGRELAQDGRDLVVQRSRLDADGRRQQHLGAERLERLDE